MNIIFAIVAIALLIVAIIDITRRKFKNPALGVVWFLVALVFPIIGPIFYLLIRNGITEGVPRKFNPKFNH